MATMNLTTGANFDFLNVNLSAMFEKSDKGYKVLVCPTTIEEFKTAFRSDVVDDFK